MSRPVRKSGTAVCFGRGASNYHHQNGAIQSLTSRMRALHEWKVSFLELTFISNMVEHDISEFDRWSLDDHIVVLKVIIT